MKNSVVNLIDLPNEILLLIFKKLDNIDLLYSLVGINQRLDNVLCSTDCTRAIDFVKISSKKKDKSKTETILNRFCRHILPKIHEHVECFTIEPCIFQRIFHTCNYTNLYKLTLVNFELNMASHIFREKSSLIQTFQHQITHLEVMFIDYIPEATINNLLIDNYVSIFALFTNLKHLELNVNDVYSFIPTLFSPASSLQCFSSSITHLRMKLNNFDDCLYLLDGRLSQLHTFIVDLDYIHEPAKLRSRNSSVLILHTVKLINHAKSALKLKCFSLFVKFATAAFNDLIAPLLRQMFKLEKLTLSLRVLYQTSFMDGIYLDDLILSRMSYLHTFHFDIVTEFSNFPGQLTLTCDDIRRRFIVRGLHVDCSIEYHYDRAHRIHVYSIPSNMEHIQCITNCFSGGIFPNVRNLFVRDLNYPFEHDFFIKISHSFPLLSRLTLTNTNEQKKKSSQQLMKTEENSSTIIEYPHLVELVFSTVHIDYVEEFLSDLNTRLLSRIVLCVKYQHLETVTKNFTRDATRANCAKIKQIIFSDKVSMVYSRDYYSYFPLL